MLWGNNASRLEGYFSREQEPLEVGVPIVTVGNSLVGEAQKGEDLEVGSSHLVPYRSERACRLLLPDSGSVEKTRTTLEVCGAEARRP